MTKPLINNPKGFSEGYHPITSIGEEQLDTGIDFGLLKLKKGGVFQDSLPLERAYLLMTGKVTFRFVGREVTVERQSIFDEDPFVLHLPAGKSCEITALSDCEIAVSRVENTTPFEERFFDSSNMLESEHRGKGQLNDTAYRIVRTVFDIRNRPEARLVVGEVITSPGKWSSYPPHHHPQPEIYHYRFTEPQGYGHAELGDDLYKIRQYDTIKILDQQDHPQAAAPGYGMYYIWIIRHLEGNNYTVPEFTKEHEWTKEEGAKVWKPKD